jgi:Uma2 family endonuclease
LDPEDRLGHTVINPVVVVEVLSPTTEKYDRTEKLAHYQLIDSVREVVLVGHEAPRVDVWRRGDDERWTEASYCDGAVELLSLGVSLPITDMYRDLPARAE